MIRLMTYNVTGALDTEAVASVIRAVDPDVVGMLEAPRRVALRRLARRADLEVVARAGRGGLHVALLAGQRTRRVSTDVRALPELPGLPHRYVVQAILSVEGERLSVIAAQLGLRSDARSLRVASLLELVDEVQAPAVVCADLNEAPGGTAGTRLGERLTDAYATEGEGPGETFPNPDPLVRTDYVFVDRAFEVTRAWVPDEPPVSVASHHRPVVVELTPSGSGVG